MAATPRWPVGFQSYTWQARHERAHPLPPFEQVIEHVAAAGYDGVETSTTMLGSFLDRPSQLRGALDAADLRLVALAFSPRSGWTDPTFHEADLAAADRLIAFLQGLGPRQRLALGSGQADAGADREVAWRHMIDQYHRVAERARSAGLAVHLHPNSSPSSMVRLRADYERLLAEIDPALIEFGPDTGHVMRGDETPLALASRHIDRVTHIHVKDAHADGAYALLGTGDAAIHAVIDLLREHRYQGWIVAEDESAEALRDPVAALSHCRDYLRTLGV